VRNCIELNKERYTSEYLLSFLCVDPCALWYILDVGITWIAAVTATLSAKSIIRILEFPNFAAQKRKNRLDCCAIAFIEIKIEVIVAVLV
jgi:hypothetical protein